MSLENPNNNRDSTERMDPEQEFQFHCYPGVTCFTQCCKDVTIALTPYDVLRLKRGLGIFSDEFLEKYTVIIPREKRLIPLILLKMNQGDKKCPFVTEDGCKVYEDRPWPCRMYPLDMSDDGTFHLITNSSRCLGLNQEHKWRIYEWLLDQAIIPYDEMNRLFSEVTIPLRAHEMDIQNPDVGKMIFMALYNLDRFKAFIFNSTFLERFEVDPIRIEKINRTDEELLKFGIDWIKFGIFGQKVFKVKQGPRQEVGHR